MKRAGERGVSMVELVIGIAITTMIVGTIGAALVATLRTTTTGHNQQRATEQLRNGFFWLNQDTQSGVASLASVADGDVTMQWTDFSTGLSYSSRYQQTGADLSRTLTVNGVATVRTVATDLVTGGFTASRSGNSVTYSITVTNGASTQARSETATMRVTDLPLTPFATVTAVPTATDTATPTVTNTPTATPTATNTATPTATATATATSTSTNTPTATPTDTATSTPTPTATNTPVPTATNTPTTIATATLTATPTATPDAWFDAGSYTGNGNSSQTISGLPFQADIIIVRSSIDDEAVVWTSAMPSGRAKRIASGNSLQTDLIDSVGATSFVVGGDNRVNREDTTFYWTAMRAGTNVAVGAYTGDGSDDRNLDIVGFQPDWLITMSDGQDDYFRPALLSGDASFAMEGTSTSSNRIQAIRPLGFEVGSNADVNESGTDYYWIAFDAGAKVMVDSYTGNGNDNRNITGLGIDPEFVWVRRSSQSRSVWSTNAFASGRSAYWDDRSTATNRIQSFIGDGFQIGNNSEVNSNSSTYYYLALAP